MSMHVNLSPEMQGFIKDKVAGGFYSSATEVIRDAVRRMQSEDERVTRFVAAVAKGETKPLILTGDIGLIAVKFN